MLKVIHLLPHLGSSGAARQVHLLTERLPRDRYALLVVGLGQDGAFGDLFRRGGIPADALHVRHRLDFGAVITWRRLLSDFEPDIIHAWRPGPCRFAVAFGRGRTVLSESLHGRRPPRLTAPERWLFRRADRTTDAIVPGVAAPTEIPDRNAFCRSLNIPVGARLIMTGGTLQRGRGFRDAVWTFDMLRYVASDVYLVVLGDGPERETLEAFTRAIARDDNRVRFAGERTDAAAVLALAEVVWVPHGSDGGASLAREAAAAGVPVVASRRPDLADIVADGETGVLLVRGRHVEWSRATLALLADEVRRRQFGAAARQRAFAWFDADRFTGEIAALYEQPSRGKAENVQR